MKGRGLKIRSRWKPVAALAGLAAAMAAFGGLVLPTFTASAPPQGLLAPIEPVAVVVIDTQMRDAGACPYGGHVRPPSGDLSAQT